MTDRQKSTHPLHVSDCFLSFKAKSFACSSLLPLSLTLSLPPPPFSSLTILGYRKMSVLFLYIFFLFCCCCCFAASFGSCSLTVLWPCSNPASPVCVSLHHCCLSILLSSLTPSFTLSLPLSLSLPLRFCAMPQGPPGPQGSPHPQPPPPNSMMGPHSQVKLPLSPSLSLSLSLSFCVFCYLQSFGNWVSQCWCVMLWHSSQLNAFALPPVATNLAVRHAEWYFIFGTFLMWGNFILFISVSVLYVTSLRWRPERSPHQDGQPGRWHTKYRHDTEHVSVTQG